MGKVTIVLKVVPVVVVVVVAAAIRFCWFVSSLLPILLFVAHFVFVIVLFALSRILVVCFCSYSF